VSGIGRVLGGRYRLQQRLGSGGMATVWLAHDGRLGREVAVKVLSDVLAGDESYRRRFEREARVAARLQHPGLVAVYDFGAEAGLPYLVMEHVRGGTLAERIAAGTVGELELATMTRDLLGALAHIHAAGIVHRDLKPGNILFGADGRARLTDFGIARPNDATTLTQTGQVIGTFAYMAPELRRGEPATPRSDLYALGVLLRDCGAERDPALAPLIDRLTAGEPGDRLASADAALAMLADNAAVMPAPHTAATEPLPATAPTVALPGASGRVLIERHHRLAPGLLLAGIAALAALLLVLASGNGDGGSRPESSEPSRATEPSEREPASTQPTGERGREETSQASCAALEEQKKALEEQKKAAEENAGDDKEAKEAIKQQFETEKKALKQRAKAC